MKKFLALVALVVFFSSCSDYQKAIKENPDTENHGKKWTTEETNELLKEIKDDISFKDIALIHKRTMGSVRGKLFQIADCRFQIHLVLDSV